MPMPARQFNRRAPIKRRKVAASGAGRSGSERRNRRGLDGLMHRVEGGADDRDGVLDRDQGGELHVARHLTDPAGRADDGVFEPQKVVLGAKAGKIGDTLKRCFESVTQDKCSHALLKKRPLILLHVGKCPPIRRDHHVI